RRACHPLPTRRSSDLVVTAKSTEYDFVSRAFFPKLKVDEDPVTGSAHCALVPFWAERLKKEALIARQVSARGGTLHCSLDGERRSAEHTSELQSRFDI